MNTMQESKNKICTLEQTQKRWQKYLKEERMLYLYAMTGFGKTTQVIDFAEKEYKEWERFSASEEDFIERLEDAVEAYEKSKTRVLLILDDLQWILKKGERQQLFELILELHRTPKVHLFLVSRCGVPEYLKPLCVTRQLNVEDQEALRFGTAEAEKLLGTFPGLSQLSTEEQEKMADLAIQEAAGYLLGMNALFARLEKNITDPKTAVALAVQDIHDYLAVHLFGEWTKARRDAVIRLSVFLQFTTAMAKQILGEKAEEILRDFESVGSFLIYEAPDQYSFVPFFHDFLEKELLKWPEAEWIPLYEQAAACYERQREFAEALRCYQRAGRTDKIAELVVYLSENAEGCAFARIAYEYMTELPKEWDERDPRILGARVMLSAYRMQPEECMEQLARLKEMADAERGCMMQGEALAAYVRTCIACPYDTADQLKDNMLLYIEYVKKNGFHLKNIMPTGNMPSVINGGLDLLPWEKNKNLLYPLIRTAAELLMGVEAVGVADAAMGEILYEQEQPSKAMGYITKAMSAANYKGSIRVQYASTAIMARMFQAEGQWDTAEELFHNLLQKVEEEKFNELLPNLHASFVYSALLAQDTAAVEHWLKEGAPNEHETFYITSRFQLMIKARACVTLGKYMEALYILNLLEDYAKLYKRTYIQIEILLLKAIVLFRREEEWKEVLRVAIELAEPYELVRVYTDQGAALLPLWKQMNWEEEPLVPKKQKVIAREMRKMANFYPGYLKEKHTYEELSRKETEVLKFMAEGCNNGMIAKLLDVNLGTVKFHVGNIMKKLEAENRTVAVKTAQEEGLL